MDIAWSCRVLTVNKISTGKVTIGEHFSLISGFNGNINADLFSYHVGICSIDGLVMLFNN